MTKGDMKTMVKYRAYCTTCGAIVYESTNGDQTHAQARVHVKRNWRRNKEKHVVCVEAYSSAEESVYDVTNVGLTHNS